MYELKISQLIVSKVKQGEKKMKSITKNISDILDRVNETDYLCVTTDPCLSLCGLL